MNRRRGTSHTAAAFALAVTLLLLAMTPAHAAAPKRSYVALGDSYTSGPAIPTQDPTAPGCDRSNHNYPHLVAGSFSTLTLRDASCSGATTTDMSQPQSVSPPIPPQLSRLDHNTRLVTLGIGGNDIGFVNIIYSCITYTGAGTPCQDHYIVNGHDLLRDTIGKTAPKIAAVLRQIHRRAPQARVLVVGYPDILPTSGPGCWPNVPFSPADLPYLRGVEQALNAMLSAVAKRNHAIFVDTYTPSIGHDACERPNIRWIEPAINPIAADPLHPNARGERGMARAVVGSMPRKIK